MQCAWKLPPWRELAGYYRISLLTIMYKQLQLRYLKGLSNGEEKQVCDNPIINHYRSSLPIFRNIRAYILRVVPSFLCGAYYDQVILRPMGWFIHVCVYAQYLAHLTITLFLFCSVNKVENLTSYAYSERGWIDFGESPMGNGFKNEPLLITFSDLNLSAPVFASTHCFTYSIKLILLYADANFKEFWGGQQHS